MDLGLKFIVGIHTNSLTQEEAEMIAEIKPLGYIFFKEALTCSDYSLSWINKWRDFLNSLKRLSGREKVIFAIDHEGGRVNRLPVSFASFPYAYQWGEHTAKITKVFNEQLTSLGFNFITSPLVDIWENEDNLIIGPRAFSKDKEEVLKQATVFINNLSRDIIYCLKHFPGHGAVIEDSHYCLPCDERNKDNIIHNSSYPFRIIIKDKTPLAIMTAHIIFSKIDNKYPATLSKKILFNLLREEFNFKGVIISDDLDMHAIVKNYPLNQAVEAFNKAQGDVMLFCHNLNRALLAKERLSKLPSSLLQPSIDRIKNLLQQASDNTPYLLQVDTLKNHQELASLLPKPLTIKIKEFKE